MRKQNGEHQLKPMRLVCNFALTLYHSLLTCTHFSPPFLLSVLSQSPLSPAPACTPQFADRAALKTVVDNYISQGCSPENPSCSTIQDYGHINNWCTTGITDMSRLFESKTTFNQYIGDWDTSSVVTFFHMFSVASTFNQYIGDWDTSSVVTFSYMFHKARTFNQYIGDWNTSSATEFDGMFFSARVFNQDLSGWDVSKATEFTNMFYGASTFNQYIGDWNTSSATKFGGMFWLASVFNQDLSGWDVSKATEFSGMFYASAFNQNLCAWKDDIIENKANTDQMFLYSFGHPSLAAWYSFGQPSLAAGALDTSSSLCITLTSPSPTKNPTKRPTSSPVVEAPCKSIHSMKYSTLFVTSMHSLFSFHSPLY